jgi:hypothetical protein
MAVSVLDALFMVRLFAKDLRGYWERIFETRPFRQSRLGL